MSDVVGAETTLGATSQDAVQHIVERLGSGGSYDLAWRVYAAWRAERRIVRRGGDVLMLLPTSDDEWWRTIDREAHARDALAAVERWGR